MQVDHSAKRRVFAANMRKSVDVMATDPGGRCMSFRFELRQALGLEPNRKEDMKWGQVSMYVCASELEFTYWQAQHKERTDVLIRSCDQKRLEEWYRTDDKYFRLARKFVISCWIAAGHHPQKLS